MKTFTRFGHTYTMSMDDYLDMIHRMETPIHPVGRSFSDCGTISQRIKRCRPFGEYVLLYLVLPSYYERRTLANIHP